MLNAGMSDYMAKPIRAHQLHEMLIKWVPMFSSSFQSKKEASSTPTREHEVFKDHNVSSSLPLAPVSTSQENIDMVYDVKEALSGVEGDWGLLQSLIAIFLNTGPALMTQIHEAYHSADYDALRKHAHQLKGSFGTLQAFAAAEAASQLEKSSKLGKSELLSEGLANLEQQFAQLFPILENLVACNEDTLSQENTTSPQSSLVREQV